MRHSLLSEHTNDTQTDEISKKNEIGRQKTNEKILHEQKQKALLKSRQLIENEDNNDDDYNNVHESANRSQKNLNPHLHDPSIKDANQVLNESQNSPLDWLNH